MDDIRPLKDIVVIRSGINIWLIVLIAVLIAAGIAIFLFLKKRKKKEAEALLPKKSPEEIAREELVALLNEHLPRKGKFKEHYTKISDIIRKYIEGRFNISALDRTTWELYEELRDKKLARGLADKVRDLLDECDMVKFAKYIPLEKDVESIYKEAVDIINIGQTQ